MARDFTTMTELLSHGFDTLIDVRSPAEFAEDHIPGAINQPALSNEERAIVGTIYKQESPFRARKIGAAMVARNVAAHLDGPLADKDGGWRPLVYCWRGGQRSGSFASIISQIGWRAETIAGGYQAYRRKVVAMLHDQPLPFKAVLIDGYTGTGKTELLQHLQGLGCQTLDLEGLANHRGSLFGGHPDGQPSQKGFETNLIVRLSGFDPAKPVILEAESSKIGDLIVPPSLWAIMVAAPKIVIDAPAAQRADYLTRRYGALSADREKAASIIASMKRLYGHERIEQWLNLLNSGELRSLAAELIFWHYDPRYARHQLRGAANILETVRLPNLEPASLAAAAAHIHARL